MSNHEQSQSSTYFSIGIMPEQTKAVIEAADPRFYDLHRQRSGLAAVSIARLNRLDPVRPYILELSDVDACALIDRLYTVAQATPVEAGCQTLGKPVAQAREALNARCDLGSTAINLADSLQYAVREKFAEEVGDFLKDY